jgi:hypothetical protein
MAVSQIVGKRLTYAELTGKVGETTENLSNAPSWVKRQNRGKKKSLYTHATNNLFREFTIAARELFGCQNSML